ncbi:MAG: MGMT family protein [Ruminococcaceae bacterium]|nr:MGMT family protein [Oscillospiraceae bacterium]
MSFYNAVYDIVKQIPKGKVATYGQIAILLGSPRASRAVGYALHFNPTPYVIPCHRVVNRFGNLAPAFAFGGIDIQKNLLEAENVVVDENYTVNLKKYLWDGKTDISGE